MKESEAIEVEDNGKKGQVVLYNNKQEAENIIDEEIDEVKVKGVKFYTINDSRGAIKQIGKIALGKEFEGLSLIE